MKKEKLNKGITLIALVITMIVLLILASVSIAMLTGENGILERASKAKEETNKQNAIEEMKLMLIDAKADLLNKGIYKANLKELADQINEKYETDVDTIIIIDYLANVTINENGITEPKALKIEYKDDYGFAINSEGNLNEDLTTSLKTEEGRTYFANIKASKINEIKFADKVKNGDYVKYSNYTDVTGVLPNYWIAMNESGRDDINDKNFYIVSTGCPVKAIPWTANHYWEVRDAYNQKYNAAPGDDSVDFKRSNQFVGKCSLILGFYDLYPNIIQYCNEWNSGLFDSANCWKFENRENAIGYINDRSNTEGEEKGAFLKIKLLDNAYIDGGSGTKSDPYTLCYK